MGRAVSDPYANSHAKLHLCPRCKTEWYCHDNTCDQTESSMSCGNCYAHEEQMRNRY